MQLKRGIRGEPDSQKWVRVTKCLGNPGLKVLSYAHFMGTAR